MNILIKSRVDQVAAAFMLQQTSLVSDQAVQSHTQLTIKTRFGDVSIDTAKAIVFPRGLLGMPDKTRFALSRFPSAKMQQFHLLQSLDDHGLAFITLPVDFNNAIIRAEDMRQAISELRIREENTATLLIVSVHRGPEQVKLSVNARAPIFIDADRKVAIQHVFQHDTYKVQQML